LFGIEPNDKIIFVDANAHISAQGFSGEKIGKEEIFMENFL
jgi:hypothetical protein